MSLFRLIARLDIKAPNLVNPIHLEGLRVIGKPYDYATRYATGGIDELLYVDVVASLYGRNNLESLIEETVVDTFVPTKIAGGIRCMEDVQRLLNAGADSVAINTGAIKRPQLINEIAYRYGSQAVAVSIECKRLLPGKWECYTDNGREKTGRDVCEWAREVVDRGAGEIICVSIDMAGTRRGFDYDLIRSVGPHVPVPVVASGGCGSPEHVRLAVEAGADAVAVADCLHYNRFTIQELRP